MSRTKSWAIEQTVDITVPTVADLPTVLAENDVRDGQGVILQAYHEVGGWGGQRLIYRAEGRSLITIDNGWYFEGLTPEGDDYLEAENKRFVDIECFGAKSGDNTFDSQPAIQAAVNACLSISTGGEDSLTGGPELIIQGGTFYINSPIVIGNNTTDGSDCRLPIKGAGWERTVIEAFPGSTAANLPWMVKFANTQGNTGNRGWRIEGIMFRGIDGQLINGVDARKAAYCKFYDCSFAYFDEAVWVRNWTVLFEHCNFLWGNTQAVITDEPGIGGFTTINQIQFRDCLFRSGEVGIRTGVGLDVNHLIVDGCQFDGATKAAIVGNGPIEKLTFTKNYLEAQGRGGQVEVFKQRKGTRWEAGITYASSVTVYDSAGNWWRRIPTPQAVSAGDDSNLGGGSDTANSWETLQWQNGYEYGSRDTVRDSAGAFWITVDGGTSSGNDSSLGTGSDSGVTWEPLSELVDGAVVLTCTMGNTSGPQGEIQGNTFYNCNGNSTLRIEGTQRLHVSNNPISGVFQNIFCTVGDTMKVSLGPLSPYQTADVLIDIDRWSQTGHEIIRKAVHFERTQAPDDSNCGMTIIDRSPKYYTTYPIVLNDLANPKVWKQDANYLRPRRVVSETGFDEVTFPGGTQMSTVAVVNKRFGGPLSRGGYLKLFGKSFGDDGTANIKIDVFDGYRAVRTFEFKTLEAAHESFSYEPVVGIEPSSPYRDWEPGQTYSVGDYRRSVYTGREFRCTTGHVSATGDDIDLAGTGNWAETDRSAKNQGRTLAVTDQPFDWKAGITYNVGEIVQSNDDGKWYWSNSSHVAAGDDSNLGGGSDTGGTWNQLDRDPTFQPVIFHMYCSNSTATNVTIKDFAICSAQYQNQLPPTLTEPRVEKNELNMLDLSWAPVGTHKWFVLDSTLTDQFEQGELITWPGGVARLVWYSRALNDHMVVRDLIGTPPVSGTTITGDHTGATIETTGQPRAAVTQAFLDGLDEAMLTGKTLRIPTGNYLLDTWTIKTLDSDVTVVCDDGVVLDVGDETFTFLSLDAGTTSSFKWTGGKIKNTKRFLYLPRVNGASTDSIHIENTEFENVLHVIEDEASGTPAIIKDAYFGKLDVDGAEEAFLLKSQQFTKGLFENIHFHDFDNPVQISAITIGSDVGLDQPTYAHGSLSIRNCVTENLNNGAVSNARGFVLYGDNIHVEKCRFENITNTGSVTDSIFFASKNGTIDTCEFHNATKSGGTVTVDGPYTTGATVNNCRFSRTDSQSPTAIEVNVDGCHVTNNRISGGGPGIDVTANQCLVTGNSLIGAHTQGGDRDTISIQGTQNRVTNNVIINCGPNIATVYALTVRSDDQASNQNLVANNIVGNVLASTNAFGICLIGSLNETNNTTIVGNHMYDLDRGLYVNTPGSVDGVKCSGNSFANVTTLGVFQSATNVSSGIDMLDAAVGPGSNDDANKGYSVGSKWIDDVSDHAYICLDATVGLAIWKNTTDFV